MMNFSKTMIAMSLGFIGAIALVEYCPKFKETLDKGKQMLEKKSKQ